MEPQISSKRKTPERIAVERGRMSFHVPYYAQVASPEWAEAVFDRGVDPQGDPRWKEWDARDAAEYAYWCSRACGSVCLKMCAEAFGGAVRPVMDWVRWGLDLGGYEVRVGEDGQPMETGWKHAVLAEMLVSSGLQAQPLRIANEEISAHISAGRLLIASVSFEIGTTRPITRRGGHLVVITGAELLGGKIASIIVHNPSGRTPALREYAAIPSGRFFQAYAGRAIAVSDRPLEELRFQEKTNV